jgi:amino acid adenylation domain-containing protein
VDPRGLPSLDVTLATRAHQDPDRIAFTVLGQEADGGEPATASLTFGELERRVGRVAARLEELHAREAPVVLAYPTSLEFVVAFLACLRAGACAVPTPLPAGGPGELRRVDSIVRDTGAAVLLTAAGGGEALAREGLTVVTTGGASALPDSPGPPPSGPCGDRAALLQYTSGSTSEPKGVVVSHANLVHNQQLIEHAFEHGPDTVIVSWLPTFHDMGLACVLQAVHAGCHSVLMPPQAFLSEPARWLRAISHFRATTSGAPDFGYALCARYVTAEQRAGLDLSSWRVAFDGSEPVRASTLHRFAETFRDAGFDERRFVPCYGLAEATLLVTASPLDAAVEVHDGFVSSGVPVGQRVAIAGPDGTELPVGEVGEVWVSGPSVAGGYWNRPEESRATFEARLAGAPAERFLRTGDLGFMRDGQLHVTGRLKDLIIVRGANHYPQDVERTVEGCAPALRRGRSAAFSVDSGDGEAVVVVCEVKPAGRDPAPLGDAIRRAVRAEHGIALHDLVLAGPGSVPLTTSGKVRRRACRAAYLDGRLGDRCDGPATEPAPAPADRGDVAAWMAGWLESTGGMSSGAPGLQLPAAAQLDSLGALTLAHAIDEAWGVRVGVAGVLACETLAALADRVEEERRGGRAPVAGGAADPDAPSLDDVRPFPLSNAQRGIWFLHALDPGGGAWTIARRFRIHGGCDPEALAGAFRRLVHRHAALRTCVTLVDGAPMQVVREWVGEPLRVHRGTAPAPGERPAPLDLEAGPLLRADLYVPGPGDQVLDVRVHHLAVDFHSFGTILDDLDAQLAGTADGRTAAPAEPDLGFAEHAAAQAGPSGRAARERGTAYWERALSGAAPALDLPARRPGARGGPGPAASLPVEVPEPVHRRLTALARGAGATPYMVYLAAYHALLNRLTARDDLVVGSPVSLRDTARRDTVGCLMNPVAVRADASGDPAFTELLGRVRASVLGALEHADHPLDLLAPALGSRAGGSPSLFDATLVWHRSDPGGRDLAAVAVGRAGATTQVAGRTWELVGSSGHAARSDLELALGDSGTAASGALTYDTARFGADAAADLVEQLATLLASIATDPARRLSDLTVSSPRQAAAVAGWQGTIDLAPLDDRTLDERFDRRAEADPGAPAIVWGDSTTSFGELRAAADGVAETLRAAGVVRGSTVAVLHDDSPAAVAAMLGVLKAGGCFAFPNLRAPGPWLAEVLAELRPAALLVDEAGRPALEAAVAAGFEHDPAAARSCAADPGAPAFVAYTSGSTGSPKGVVQSHRAFAQFLDWQSRCFGIGPGTRMAHWSALSYDAAYCEILGTLCFGATLVMSPREVRHDPAAFAELVERAGVGLLQTIPSYLRQLLRAAPGTRLGSLEQVMLAGEPLPLDLAADWRAAHPSTPLFNLYGPTETVLATWHATSAGDGEGAGSAPIGRPIEGREVRVLDGRGRLVPIGAVGEVFVASRRLADGYQARPAQTAAAFVPADSDSAPGLRMYRTGDLASWSSGGVLRFHGRRDGQMKVRGMRVEAGEVEAALQRHPDVVECAVVGRRDEVGGTRVEAHLVTTRPVADDALRAHLGKLLPPHMVPARFGLTSELPRTLTGKVARGALPPLAAPSSRAVAGPPRGATELLVAALWSEVLGTGELDAGDDFFGLGGNSLAAMQLANRMTAIWGTEVPVATVFEAPTVRGQAEALDRLCEAGTAMARWAPLLDEVERLSDAEVRDALGAGAAA